MIRVIHFMPSINITSGIAQMIMNYYRIIDRSKIQFDFVYFIKKSEVNFENEIIALGGNCTRVTPPSKYKKFNEEMNEVFNCYKDEKVVFHNHQIYFEVFLEPILRRNNINNIIVHNHMTKYSDKMLSSIRNRILCIPIKFLNVKYFACSYDAGVFMFGEKNIKNITIMNNGIDCKKYCYNSNSRELIREELGLENKYILGHIGHFEKVKNHRFILAVFEELRKMNKEAHLLLVGTGTLRKKIQEDATQRGIINNITILENRRDIAAIMSCMDVFIFPSLFEGLGIAAIEAQAAGLPVFMSENVPKDVEIVNCNTLRLDEGYKKWAKAINNIKVSEEDRRKANEMVIESKFNILKLEKKYFDYIIKLYEK